MKYKLEKIYAWIKWAVVIILNDGILKILAMFIYPLLVYPTRSIIRFFWYKCGKFGRVISFFGFIFLNDPEDDGECDDYGVQDYRNSIGFPKPLEEYNFIQKWWISYRWSGLRNNNWNAHRFFKPKYNDHSKYTDLDIIAHDGYKYLCAVNYLFLCDKSSFNKSDALDFCVLKYKDSQGNGVDNFGDIIDYEKSILGKNFVYYRVNGVLYFRYSKAWVNWDKAREIQLGTNGRRFKIRVKFKKLKV